MAVYEGMLVGSGLRFGVVVSRFNNFITERLLDGATDGLRRHGVDMETVDVAWVPGTFEMPIVAKKMAKSGQYDAVICLGAVIRGGTPHFDYVATQVSRGGKKKDRNRLLKNGAAGENRTLDLTITNGALYH